MNENYQAIPMGLSPAVTKSTIDHNPTVGDNIDEKIRYYESEIVRLKQSKEDLAPLLKMRIRDIRQAMDY